MSKRVIISDLDGTITRNDTFFLAVFTFGSWKNLMKLFFFFLYLYPLYVLGKYDRNKMKEIVARIIFTEFKLSIKEELKNKFLARIRLNDEVLKKVAEYQKAGYEFCLVTASLDFYVELIREKINFKELICTRVVKNNDILTGEFAGKNCNYEEKVKRIKKKYSERRDRYQFVSFGNSKGDYEMFEYADDYYYVDKKGKLSELNPKLK